MHTRAPFVIGRTEEQKWLDEALAAAREDRGCAVFVSGEPGIGKTRLATETIGRAVDAGMVVLRGRCSTTGPPVPFRPLSEALLSLVRSGDPELPRRLGPYRPVLGRLVLDWADADTPAGDGSLVVLAEAVLRLAALAGRGRGCLLAIEDLHDADVETLAVLEYLVGNTSGQPILVLATVRAEPSAAAELAEAAARRGESTLLALGRLDADQVHQVVTDCIGGETPVPREVSTQLYEGSAGNPLVVEELLHSVLAAGDLVPGRDGWRLVNRAGLGISMALVQTISRRAERLGAEGVRLLSVAAVLGRTFPISVVQRVMGLDDRNLLGHLRSAVTDQLLAPDERGPDWYAFQHPLTAEAMLTSLTPADRAALSEQAARAVLAEHPDLPGEWCHLAASLRLQAGQRWAAAALHVEIGRRAVTDGAPGTAVAALEDAVRLLGDERADPDHRDDYGELLETLLLALAEAGQFDRALGVADELDVLGAGRGIARQVESHVRLAWAAQVAGRWAEGAAQVEIARSLLPAEPDERQTVAIDAVDAYLTMAGPVADRVRRSEELARRAVAGAERIPLPSTACQALYAVGFVVRDRDIAQSDECFRRMLDLAAEHRLTSWRNYALIGLGGNSWLAEADPAGLERARSQALRTGGISLAHNASAVLGLHAVLCGDFDRAAVELDECLAETTRIKLAAVTRYALMAKAVLAGHRGDRDALRAAVVAFGDGGGERSSEAVLVTGLARVFCALLEEDRAAADGLLARIAEDQARQQSTFYLAGPYGLKLLLDVLAGVAGRADHRSIAAGTPGRMRWNRQFVLLADAVLAGREGRPAEAEAAFAAAARAAEPFALARHLGLRLVAECALRDGWGCPIDWLREAEEHFHHAGVTPVASACRALLRRHGAPVRQRRAGADRVPEGLRRLGVTSREYEVFELLPTRLGNKALAARLHISARTVEKHVASLLAKAGKPDRATLAEYAADILAGH